MSKVGEYVNAYVMVNGHAYRVAFHRKSRRTMIVCRKTKFGETPLNIDGPTGKKVAHVAALRVWIKTQEDRAACT